MPFELHLPPKGYETWAAFDPRAARKAHDAETTNELSYLSHLVVFERLHYLAHEFHERPSQAETSLSSAPHDGKAGQVIFADISQKELRQPLPAARQLSGWTGALLEDVALR